MVLLPKNAMNKTLPLGKKKKAATTTTNRKKNKKNPKQDKPTTKDKQTNLAFVSWQIR